MTMDVTVLLGGKGADIELEGMTVRVIEEGTV